MGNQSSSKSSTRINDKVSVPRLEVRLPTPQSNTRNYDQSDLYAQPVQRQAPLERPYQAVPFLVAFSTPSVTTPNDRATGFREKLTLHHDHINTGSRVRVIENESINSCNQHPSAPSDATSTRPAVNGNVMRSNIAAASTASSHPNDADFFRNHTIRCEGRQTLSHPLGPPITTRQATSRLTGSRNFAESRQESVAINTRPVENDGVLGGMASALPKDARFVYPSIPAARSTVFPREHESAATSIQVVNAIRPLQKKPPGGESETAAGSNSNPSMVFTNKRIRNRIVRASDNLHGQHAQSAAGETVEPSPTGQADGGQARAKNQGRQNNFTAKGKFKKTPREGKFSRSEFIRTPIANVRFVPLNYPFIKMHSNGTVAECVLPPSNEGESFRPIVYVNQPLSHGMRFIVNIEESKNSPKSALMVGLTTCSPEMLSRYFYHVNNECRGGQFDCKGYSLTLSIYSNEGAGVKKVHIERLQSGALARLTSFFVDTSVKSRAFKDMTAEQKLSSSEQVYPFLVLDGSATKVKISGEKLTKPAQPVKQNVPLSEAPAKQATQVDFTSLDSWILGKSIQFASGFMSKEGDGDSSQALYVMCKGTIAPGQENKFIVTQIDDNCQGTITIGLTTNDPCKVNLDCLLGPLSLAATKKWKVCCNILPTVALGDEISIMVDQLGIHLKSPKGSSVIINQVPPKAHLFLHFGGKVKQVRWVSPEAKGKEATAEVKQDSDSRSGTCCICLTEPSNHILLPCGHICVCGDCVVSLKNQCPICTKPFTSRQKVYFS